MAQFVVRRILGMIAVLFAISVIVFLIFNVVPTPNCSPGSAPISASTSRCPCST